MQKNMKVVFQNDPCQDLCPAEPFDRSQGFPKQLLLSIIKDPPPIHHPRHHVIIRRPYVLVATDALRCGSNALRVEVTNTLACAVRDPLSRFAPQDPTGLIGPVQLRWSEVGSDDQIR